MIQTSSLVRRPAWSHLLTTLGGAGQGRSVEEPMTSTRRTHRAGTPGLEPSLENFRGRDCVVECAEHQRVEFVLVFGPQHRVVWVDQEAFLAH